MPRIQDVSIPQALRKRFGIKGVGDFSTIAPELVGVVLVDDVRVDPSIARPAWGATVRTAVAGEISHIQFVNPSGSGLLITLERLVLSPGASTTIILKEDTAVRGSPGANVVGWRNRIYEGKPVLQLVAFTDPSTLGNPFVGWYRTAAEAFAIDVEYSLAPGTILNAMCNTVNTELIAWALWNERPLRAEESV